MEFSRKIEIMEKSISIVIPVFNEEDILPFLFERLEKVCKNISIITEIIWIDDGSLDNSANLIKELIGISKNHKMVRFSRNFGHQAAVTAGLVEAKGDAVVVIDADLQDPPELIEQMIKMWKKGADVVYGVRRTRDGSVLLRLAYFIFYRLLNFFSEIEIPLDSGDFALMDRKVINSINALPETLRFVRGIRAWVGFKQEALGHDRPARYSGKSKYSFRALYRLAVEGIASFSLLPLKISQLGAFCLGTLGIVFVIIVVILKISSPSSIPDWMFLTIVTLFIGSFQLLCIYLLGAYIGRTFIEVKRRPPYIIMERIEK